MAVRRPPADRLQLLGLTLLRVLGLVHQYVPVRNAGAESHIHSMFRALAERGHRVDVVLSMQIGDPYVFEGVNIWPCVDRKRDVFPWLADADIIVAHLDNTTRATVLGEFNDIPVAIVHHNTFEASREALALTSSRTDLVAVNSEHMKAGLRVWCDEAEIPMPNTVVVRPTADPSVFATTPGDRVTLINMRRRDDEIHRDHLSKGGETFRAVAERLPDVDFLGVTGAYGTQVDVSDLPNVEVIDHVPHDEMVEKVYARTKVLLVPSSYESWGRVASEAMCSGIPVIASPTPGLVEQIGPDAGTFVDPDDYDRWVDAVSRLLTDPHHWHAMSMRSKGRASKLDQLGRGDLQGWVRAVEETVVRCGVRVNA